MAERRLFGRHQYPDPEQNNNPPVERGGSRFNVTTEPRTSETRTPTREAPLPPTGKIAPSPEEKTLMTSPELDVELTDFFNFVYPTKEKMRSPNNGAYAGSTRAVEKVAGKWGGRIVIASGVGIAAIVGYTANEIYQNSQNSAVHESVESFSNSFTDTRLIPSEETNKINPEKAFDPTATKEVISEDIKQYLPQKEINKLYPTAFGKLREDGDNKVVSLAQPDPKAQELQFEIREDKGTLQVQYPLDLSQSTDPNSEISYKRSFNGLTATDRLALKDKGYYDQVSFYDVPKGTIIEAPLDGFLTISETTETNGVKKAASGFIDFQAPNGNIYRLVIGGLEGDNRFVLSPLLDTPDINEKKTTGYGISAIGTYGISVKRGQGLFQTDRKLDVVGFEVMMAIKGEEGKPQEWGTQPFVPTSIELLTSHDNKLLVPSKQ